jgi:hypothetical protein
MVEGKAKIKPIRPAYRQAGFKNTPLGGLESLFDNKGRP